MRTLKLSAIVVIVLSIFSISSVMAKTDLSVAPVDMSIAPPAYGSTNVDPIQTSVATSAIAAQAMNSNMINQSFRPPLPINNNIVFLLIAGLAIGVKVMIARNKTKNALNY